MNYGPGLRKSRFGAFLISRGVFFVPSLDHLSTIPDKMCGLVVSVTPTTKGYNFVVVDDSGVDTGNRNRWIGYSSDVSDEKRIRVGDRIRFLPGQPRAGKPMGRAYDVELDIADKEINESRHA
jgi:hypothetical protein